MPDYLDQIEPPQPCPGSNEDARIVFADDDGTQQVSCEYCGVVFEPTADLAVPVHKGAT